MSGRRRDPPAEPDSFADAEAAVRADERAIRARELHDTIGQSLVALTFEVARLVRHADSGGAMVRPLAEALATQLEAAVALVRSKQSAWLAAAEGKAPAESFARAVVGRTEDAARRAGIAFAVEVDVDDRRLDPAAARAAGRALSAALDNVVRHARASRVRVAATLDDGGLVVVVEDDGQGLRAGFEKSPTATGILSMRERTAAYRGEAAVEARPGGGTRVRLTFPAAVRSNPTASGSEGPR